MNVISNWRQERKHGQVISILEKLRTRSLKQSNRGKNKMKTSSCNWCNDNRYFQIQIQILPIRSYLSCYRHLSASLKSSVRKLVTKFQVTSKPQFINIYSKIPPYFPLVLLISNEFQKDPMTINGAKTGQTQRQAKI